MLQPHTDRYSTSSNNGWGLGSGMINSFYSKTKRGNHALEPHPCAGKDSKRSFNWEDMNIDIKKAWFHPSWRARGEFLFCQQR